MSARSRTYLPLLLILGACPGVDPAVDKRPPPEPVAPGKDVVQAPLKADAAPDPSPRLSGAPASGALKDRVSSYFERAGQQRIYLQVDKPLYKPGETVWLKSWDLRVRDFAAKQPTGAIRYELVSPKGAVVIQKNIQEDKGIATNDFEIPDSVQGGEYQVRAIANDGASTERPIIVSTYEAPRLKKKLEFVKKAYGAGDEVTATIKVERPTGEALASHPLKGVIWLDGETLAPANATTNGEGGALIRFKLPDRIEKGDGLLTVMIDDGGITESISRRIPILVKKLDFAFFPEGGQMLAGTPGRIYFEAKNPIGKPADVEGRIVDDHGNVAATFSTYHAGLGRIDLVPNTGRKYFAEISRPAGITEKYALPVALEQGCSLSTYDDLDGAVSDLRVAIRCTEAKKVVVLATVRENLLDEAFVEVPAGSPAVVYLKSSDDKLNGAQGVARVTVFDEALNPLAERLVYRNRRNGLALEITPDKAEYSPREQVALTLKTTDSKGTPLPAEVALSVVDDTVLSFADDKNGHMLSRLYLEAEIPEKVEEPNFFFDLTKEKSALAMDLLMGTRGYRRFEWQQVFMPPAPTSVATAGIGAEVNEEEGGAIDGFRGRPMARPEALPPAPPKGGMGMGKANKAPMPQRAAALAAPAPVAPADPAPQREEAKKRQMPAKDQAPAANRVAAGRARGDEGLMGKIVAAEAPPAELQADEDWAADKAERVAQPVWAPVRVFPAPVYRGDETGPRTDFRETIHWAPSVFTGKDGRATVTFYLSDGVSSFRVLAEGIGAGAAGRTEKVIKSSLPFNMSVKLPLEVTAGDTFLLPLTLSNEKDKPVEVEIEASFGELVQLNKGGKTVDDDAATLTVETTLKTKLAAKERRSVFYPLTVGNKSGKSKIRVFANAGGLTDEFIRELDVVPLGFPQLESKSGTLKDLMSESFDLGEALDDTAQLTVKLYPSPVSTLVSGLEGMLREPSGCFEQTSSTNYPNIMVLDYLKAHDVADPDLLERTNGLLDRGYQRLVGYETPNKGYEWFGQSPPHEALSAYGVLEFVDMKRVSGTVDEAMLARTQAWLKSRRDGKGGFQRDSKALDSFGGAKPEITDAYIVYALTEAGTYDLDEEIKKQASTAASTQDAYLLALATNTLLNVPARKAEGKKAADRLAGMQTKTGSWMGADHSITRSTGINLEIETTALTLLALMKAGGYDDKVRGGIDWLTQNRSGFGQWGATQATVLALKAMTTYSTAARKTQSPGSITLKVNDQSVITMTYEAGRRDAMVLTAPARFFQKGKNKIELMHDGGGELPYSLALEYRSLKPASSDRAVVDITTQLEKTTAKMGENVRLTAVVKNKTAEGQPMTIARIGLPGGLTFQTWQLKELKDKGLVAFTETRAREVVVYFRDLKPNEEKQIPLDLVATIPGDYTGPASSGYLYYSDDAKVWIDGLKVQVRR